MKRLVLFLILLLAGNAGAIGFGASVAGDSAMVTYTHSATVDSVIAVFEYPEGNTVDSIRLTALADDKTLAEGNLDGALTTVATYKVRFNIWEVGAGSVSESEIGTHRVVADTLDANAHVVTIANAAITEASIAPNAITSSEIANDALDGAKFTTGYYNNIVPDTNKAGDSLAIQPEYWTGADSSAYQGSAGIWTELRIDSLFDALYADYDLDALDSNHVVDAAIMILNRIGPFSDTGVVSINVNLASYIVNTMQLMLDSLNIQLGSYSGQAGDDNNVKDDIDALALTGGGSEAETLIVLSTGDSTQIEGASITVRTIDQSTVKVDGVATDVNGKRILELDPDPDSFFVAVTHNNYTFITDTIVVASGGQTDTLFMTLFNPGSASGNLTRVYNNIKDINQTPIQNATIEAKIPRSFWPVTHDNEARIARYSTKSDTLGNWSMDVLSNAILLTGQADSASHYVIKATSGSEKIFEYKVTVPADSAFKMVPDSD